MTDETPIRLPFEPGDVCVHAHANGAVYVVNDRHEYTFTTLANAVAVAGRAREGANTVFLAWDNDDSPLVHQVLDAVRATGVVTSDFGTLIPPFTFHDGTNALMVAAGTGETAIVDELIARGVDVDERDDHGATALHHGALRGHVGPVRALLDAGATTSIFDAAGITALGYARRNAHDDVAALLDPRADTARVRYNPPTYDADAATSEPVVARTRGIEQLLVLAVAAGIVCFVVAAVVASTETPTPALLFGTVGICVLVLAARRVRGSAIEVGDDEIVAWSGGRERARVDLSRIDKVSAHGGTSRFVASATLESTDSTGARSRISVFLPPRSYVPDSWVAPLLQRILSDADRGRIVLDEASRGQLVRFLAKHNQRR